MTEQRGVRSIAMPAEVDAFQESERMCRVASADATGGPHVSPLWFVWDGVSLWLNSIVRSQRWTDRQRHPLRDERVGPGVPTPEQQLRLDGLGHHRADHARHVAHLDRCAPDLDTAKLDTGVDDHRHTGALAS